MEQSKTVLSFLNSDWPAIIFEIYFDTSAIFTRVFDQVVVCIYYRVIDLLLIRSRRGASQLKQGLHKRSGV